jgi:CDP-glycerol glycerophosphotransferase (TagB/SpsB family)
MPATPLPLFRTLRSRLLNTIACYSAPFYHLFTFLFPVWEKTLCFALRPQRGAAFLSPLINAAEKEGSFIVVVLEGGPGIVHYFKIMYTLARSKIIIIDSHYRYLYGVRPRKETIVIQAWHAAGLFKKFAIGICAYGDAVAERKQRRQHCSYSYFLTSSPFLNEAYAEAFGKKPEQALALGTVKTDALHTAGKKSSEFRETFDREFPQARRKKLILYAPTYRDEERQLLRDSPETKLPINIDARAFAEKFGSTHCIAFRAHYYHKNEYALDPGYINVTEYPLPQLLAAADILITDYSSIVFDFSFFVKPIIFFVYDLETYHASRGFYVPFEEFVPGPICRTQEEVYTVLRDMPSCNPTVYEEFRERYLSACDGKVCDKIMAFLKALPPL